MWRLAADPRTLASCADETGTVEVLDERHARVRTRFGGAGGFAAEATIEWMNLEPFESLTVVVRSSVAGTTVRLPTRLVLRDADGEGTIVSWSAAVEATGLFAGFAAGIVRGEAARLIEGLVACMERVLASQPGTQPGTGTRPGT